jgi:hypothetical protein
MNQERFPSEPNNGINYVVVVLVLIVVGFFIMLFGWRSTTIPPTTKKSKTPPANSPSPNRQQIKYNECVRQRTAAGLSTAPCAEWSRE